MTPRHELLSRTPCDIRFVNTTPDAVSPPVNNSFWNSLTIDYFDCGFRGVSIDSLPAVLQRGIDVSPTNAVMYVDHLEKALGYGGWPKVLLALKWDSIKRTFKEMPVGSSKEEIQIVRKDFPTAIELNDRSIWCTRLAEDDPRIATDYEIAYARWIPGNPWDALRAIVLVGGSKDRSAFEILLNS